LPVGRYRLAGRDGGMNTPHVENERLVEYGITTEQSDYRLHICFAEGYAYLYPTEAGREAVASGNHTVYRAYQPGVGGATALGVRVSPTEIPGCKRTPIPPKWLEYVNCQSNESTPIKGRKAVEIAVQLLKRGKLPIELRCNEACGVDLQISGVDLIVTSEVRIQVKCDYYGGLEPTKYPTAGLYLQTHERNPRGLH